MKTKLMIVIAFLGLAFTSCKKDNWTPAKDGAQIEMLTPGGILIVETTEDIQTVTTSTYMEGKVISMANLSFFDIEFSINGKIYKLKGRD